MHEKEQNEQQSVFQVIEAIGDVQSQFREVYRERC